MTKLERRISLLKSDAKHYPGDDPSGYYTTVDITRIHKNVKMDRFQDSIKKGFINPIYQVETSLGFKKYFCESQVYMIGFYYKLLDFGVSRESANTWTRAFQNLRADSENKGKDTVYPDFVVIEMENRQIKRISLFCEPIELNSTIEGNDIIVINYRKIINQIQAYLKP